MHRPCFKSLPLLLEKKDFVKSPQEKRGRVVNTRARARFGGCATQRELWKDDHLFGSLLASHVRGIARVHVYLARSFVSSRNLRPFAVQGL